jgi:hypothetical protein
LYLQNKWFYKITMRQISTSSAKPVRKYSAVSPLSSDLYMLDDFNLPVSSGTYEYCFIHFFHFDLWLPTIIDVGVYPFYMPFIYVNSNQGLLKLLMKVMRIKDNNLVGFTSIAWRPFGLTTFCTKNLSWLCFFAQGEKRVTLLIIHYTKKCQLHKF